MKLAKLIELNRRYEAMNDEALITRLAEIKAEMTEGDDEINPENELIATILYQRNQKAQDETPNA